MKRDVRRLKRSARLLRTSVATADWYSKRLSTADSVDENVNNSGGRRLMQKSQRHVNYGALSTPYSVVGEHLRLTILC